MNKAVRSVMPETSLAEAMSLMRIYHADGLPVTVDKLFVGHVWMEDILAFFSNEQEIAGKKVCMDMDCLLTRYAPLMRIDVKRVMAVTNRAVLPTMSINEAMLIMLKDRVCSLAVTERARLVGQVDYEDVNKAILALSSTKVAA